jgi:exodeoxyribonuclease-3
MYRVITANVNGLRSAAKKGFYLWLSNQQADVVCLQEIKVQEHQLEDEHFYPKGYHSFYFPAEKPGYSGVAVYTKEEPLNVSKGLGFPLADTEGRYLQVDFKKISVASLYLPSGTSGDHRQKEKYFFLDEFLKTLKRMRKETHEYIICGDWNIAHKPIDLKNWKGNQKNSGFLPEERAWLDNLFDHVGFVDAFRLINQEPDQYTWWSNRGQAWAKNVGWRIDYQIISPGLSDKVRKVAIYKDERFSDHAPLIMDYDL